MKGQEMKKKQSRIDVVSIKKNGGSNITLARDYVDFTFEGKRYRAYFEARRFGWFVFELKIEEGKDFYSEFSVPKKEKVVKIAYGEYEEEKD